MNLRQAHAPLFRPLHKLSRKATTVEEENAARDRQVIDLHWRAHSDSKPTAPVGGFPLIFDSAPFDFASAERFAMQRWSGSAKEVHLHITDEMQWEHAIIRGKSVRKTWAVIELGDVRGREVKQAGAPHIEIKLRNEVRRRDVRQVDKSIPGMVDAWKARRIAGHGPAKVARMIALMTGKPERDSRAVARTLKALDDYLGKSA